MVNKKEIKKIAKKYNLSLILAFGSQITGKTHKDSDLDIGVMAREDLDYKERAQLLFDLQKIYPKNEIDLVLINNADPLLLKKILENCQLLYGPKKDFTELKIISFKKYCDYQKYFTLEREFVHKFIKEFV